MAADHVLAVDLATVWTGPNRSGFIRVIGWGHPIEVLAVTDKHVEVRVWRFERQPDGSEKPIPASGFIAPTKSSGLKPADLAIPKAQNQVLKMDFVDVQQGDASVVEVPVARSSSSTAAKTSCLRATWRGGSETPPTPRRSVPRPSL